MYSLTSKSYTIICHWFFKPYKKIISKVLTAHSSMAESPSRRSSHIQTFTRHVYKGHATTEYIFFKVMQDILVHQNIVVRIFRLELIWKYNSYCSTYPLKIQWAANDKMWWTTFQWRSTSFDTLKWRSESKESNGIMVYIYSALKKIKDNYYCTSTLLYYNLTR